MLWLINGSDNKLREKAIRRLNLFREDDYAIFEHTGHLDSRKNRHIVSRFFVYEHEVVCDEEYRKLLIEDILERISNNIYEEEGNDLNVDINFFVDIGDDTSGEIEKFFKKEMPSEMQIIKCFVSKI